MKKDIFEYIGKPKRPKQSKFNLSHSVKGDIVFGELQPTMFIESMPNDKFLLGVESMHRGMPFISPVMHRINQWTHTFEIPTRLLYENEMHWDVFITGGSKGDGYTDGPNKVKPVNPCINLGAMFVYLSGTQVISEENYTKWFGPKSLWQYLGYPAIFDTRAEFIAHDWTNLRYSYEISLLPFMAYQKCYFEYFSDQNLEEDVFRMEGLEAKVYTAAELFGNMLTPAVMEKGEFLFTVRTRAYEKDYFTSSLPWTQRGPEITIEGESSIEYSDVTTITKEDGSAVPSAQPLTTGLISGTGRELVLNNVNTEKVQVRNIDSFQSLITVNALRIANRLQEWVEKQARGGARYVETFLNHFNVHVGDRMTKRPTLIGTTKAAITISEVLQTGQPTGDSTLPQGNMSGHSISIGGNKIGSIRTKEYGYIITISSMLPENSYVNQGMPRYAFNRQDKLNYAWPEFANLGEQEVWQRELYFLDDEDENEPTLFGYQSRYVEMKQIPDITRGSQAGNLNFWNLARKFNASPNLNFEFVNTYLQTKQVVETEVAEEPFNRIFAVQDVENEQFLFQQINHVSVIRSLPFFGTPKM